MATTKTKASSKKKSKNIGRIYKAMALSFVGVALLLSTIVFFIASAKTTITITTTDIAVSAEENIEILLSEGSLGELQTSGQLIETTYELTKTFKVAKGETKETQATGEVTIINSYSKKQPLISSTRFLSENGTLFRLKDGVTVPAGGEVSAEIYADEIGVSGEVKAGKFTIPGLWSGLQDKIYATSTTATTGGTSLVGVLTQEDVDTAVKQLGEKITQEGSAKLRLELSADDSALNYKINENLVSQEITKQVVSDEVGTKTDQFDVTLETGLKAVAINENEVFELMKKQLEKSVPDAYKLDRIDPEGFSYILENHNADNDKVKTIASLSGTATLDKKENLVDKKDLLGLSVSELDSYFSNKTDVISDVEYDFSPSWLKKVSTNKSNIKLIIK